MKRELFFGAVLALAMSVGLGAQYKQHDQGTAMLTGCLAPFAQHDSTMGTTGTTDTSATSETSRHAAERFTLLNPKAGPAASSSNGDVTPSADAQVLLQGTNLKQYAGHTVEVRGQFVESKASAAHEEHSGHDDHNLRIFRVASVTNVGSACSTSGR